MHMQALKAFNELRGDDLQASYDNAQTLMSMMYHTQTPSNLSSPITGTCQVTVVWTVRKNANLKHKPTVQVAQYWPSSCVASKLQPTVHVKCVCTA